MNFVSALFAVVAFVAELFSIYNFIASRAGTKTRTYSILGMVGAGILLGALFLGNLPATSGAYGPRNTTPPTSNTQPQATGVTPVQARPTQPPTLPPQPGTVLYQADSSWSGWSGTKEWKVLNGMLTNNGSGYPGQPTILAPDVLQVSDYAVEASIQVVNWPRCCYSQFAIVVRASTNSDGGWQGYSIGDDLQNPSTEISTHAGDFGSSLANAPFDPGAAWHTYRIEVKGDTIKLLIDGGVKLAITDNSYLSGGQIGFWSYEVQLNINSFKIIAL